MAMGTGTTSKTAAPQPKTATPAQVVKSGISLAPSTFTEGGGLLDDADVTIHEAAFLMWDYDGQYEAGPALGITFRVIGDAENKDHDQYFSAGKAQFFVPSEDGKFLVPVADKTGLVSSSNAALFLSSLISVGVPEGILASGDISQLTGMQLHVNRVPAPERKGLAQDPNKRKQEVLVATKLIALPGEAPKAGVKAGLSKTAGATATSKAAPAQGATATSPSSANGAAAADDLTAETVQAVVEVLAAEGGSVARKSIGPKVFAVRRGHKDQAAIMKLAFSEDFLLSAGEGSFTYDGTTISMG